MTRPDRIPDPRQKIRYWVGQTHSFSFIPRSLPTLVFRDSGRTCGNVSCSCQLPVTSFQLFLHPFDSIAICRPLHEQTDH
jgi:hypothetical protein